MMPKAPALSAEVRDRLLRVVRRSAVWFVPAIALALMSIPAIFDLQGLFVGLSVICAALGLVTAVFTWFDPRTTG